MKSRFRFVAPAVLGLLVVGGWAPSLRAQVVTTGTIVVVVEDTGGGRVPGAAVVAAARDTASRREVTTNAEGEATLVNLAPSAGYVVTTQLSGFNTVKRENVLVRSGQTTSLRVQLAVSDVAEEIVVTAESPTVDTTSAVTGQDITLELTESLPTGRSYQSYLQLVPGVLPDDRTQSGNPASKSGLNYSDILGENGISRDNFYYIDGVNVTDGVTGTFGANLNTEIIQEQQVLTGGIPAEFVGTPGLLSSVVTKSGNNTWHGSANYFFQNDSLVAKDENAPAQGFSRFDTAATLGGPIIRDKAWFFASFRRLERQDDIAALDTGAFLRRVEQTENQSYGRLTWSPTSNDTLSVTYFADPFERSGRTERDITNSQDRRREQGGANYKATYSRLVGDVVFDLAYAKHNGEVSDFANVTGARNNVIYRSTDSRTTDDEKRGGFGIDSIDERDTELAKASIQWHVKGHVIKGGFERAKNRNFLDELVSEGLYTSLAPHLSGLSAGDLSVGSFSDLRFDPLNPSDFSGFISTIDSLPNRADFYAAYDANADGTITPDELAARLTFSSTAGNPGGVINYERTLQSPGPKDFHSTGLSFYLQDSFPVGRLHFNLGLRVERFEHFATTGESIYAFPWTWAPRLAVAWDIKGDGRMKATAYYGKYYDPIRNNMTEFAGTLSGAVVTEQVFALNEWVTYRTRGGPQRPDALFAPTTKTPFTDDMQVGYQVDLGRNMSVELLGTRRRTRDILEDYDLSLYALLDDGTTAYPGPIDHPDSMFLGLDYFGYSQFPNSNFVIATLAGGKRNYKGLDAIFRKRLSNNWQALVSYSLNDAQGNTNSDSNADFQGDVIFLDPRAPNQYGDQPGMIRHIVKAAGSYHFPFGLELGGVYRWNSGTLASRTFRTFSRNLPVRVSADENFEFAGINQDLAHPATRWIAPGAVGGVQNPSWGQVDLRVQYVRVLAGKVRGEFFVDIFNALDYQGSTRNQDLVAGVGGTAFGEPIRFNAPRSFFLGARFSF